MDKRSLYGYSGRGSPWPFTYLCYDFASLDLIDGIAINLRISRGREDDQDESRRETRKLAPVYTHTHIFIRAHVFIYTRVYVYIYGRVNVHPRSKRIPMNTD